MSYTPYVGRFAPSPTGPLHFGSLVAAVASYLDARANKGRWLIRMDDIDPPREVAGAADDILNTLHAFGFIWDDDVFYQSAQRSLYQTALDSLINQQHAYPCICSRKQVSKEGKPGPEGVIYPGTCRGQKISPHPEQACSVRVKTHSTPYKFIDLLQGEQAQALVSEVGDFVIKRTDGYWSYQLANVIDDATMAITHVVRGADLLRSTPRQIHLQQLLNLPIIQYAHIPLVRGINGEKLAKGNGAQAVKPGSAALWDSLVFLGQSPPRSLRATSLAGIWDWAIKHWRLNAIAR